MADYESEEELESNLIQQLVGLGYKQVKIGNIDDSLEDHFRQKLNQINADNLKGQKLSNKEFERVKNEMIGARSIFETGKLLRGSELQPYGKINITRDNGEGIYLTFFDAKNYQNNDFEVTHQVKSESKYKNRYDVTILINGLPLVQIELKRRDVELNQAFNQIIRYREETMKDNFFKYVQLFVISNGVDTRYFSNQEIGNFNSNFMFVWTDKNNKWINEINEFATSFLNLKRLHSMIARYTIFDNENKSMLIMRPYQVYATEAILNQAINHPDKNGFIWHTTGSGKTITSFKAAQLMAQQKDIEKVIFMIDRHDLDTKSVKNFNSYLSEENRIDMTDSSFKLVKQLNSNDNKLIVTTIQKMNSAIKNEKQNCSIKQFRDKHVVFIEDECHRSQFGEMRVSVNKWFGNAQHFGFTGTPIFEENMGTNKRTTENLYDECLHKYLIKDAVRDMNVLPFNVQYMSTFKDKGIDYGNEKVEGIDTQEVYESEKRMRKIVEHILLNHRRISGNGMYNAIFAVSSTKMALKYYSLFKEYISKMNGPKINVTTIFTWQDNEDSNESNQKSQDSTSRHGLDNVISDYNKLFGTNFDTNNFNAFSDDITNRMVNHQKDTPKQNIDILIVVNMFLTGFDSKKLSTLYIDKNLQWHGLIQTYSRTNRVEKSTKPFGNIISYRNLKKPTDDAIQLFSAGDSEKFLVEPYKNVLNDFKKSVYSLKEYVSKPEEVDSLRDQGNEALKKFVELARDVFRKQNQLRFYEEFDWNKIADVIDKGTFQRFQGKYLDVKDEFIKKQNNKESIMDDIDFELSLLAVDQIDVGYILNLIQSIDLTSKKRQKEDIQVIKKSMENTANTPNLRLKADLIREFLEKVIPTLNPNDNIKESLNDFFEKKRQRVVGDFSRETKLSESQIDELFHDYDKDGEINTEKLTPKLNKLGYGLFKKREIAEKTISFIKETSEIYDRNVRF